MRVKHLIALVLPMCALTAQAGDESKEVIAPKGGLSPAVAPTLYQWFAGGTVGYLNDYDTEFFSGHIGLDMNYQLGGWNTAMYLELGYFDADECGFGSNGSGYGNGSQTAATAQIAPQCVDLEVMPLTLNYKLERNLSNNLNAYIGAGAGIAFVEASGGGSSADDEVFYGQVFGGLLYQASEAVEIFGGVRWIYMEDASFNGTDFDLGDDFLGEVGVRFNF